MSKVLEAACAAGIVTVSGIPVVQAVILTKGTGPSTGILVIDEDKAWYVATNTTDLSSAIDSITSALGQIAAAMTLISTSVSPPGGPLSNAAGVASAAANITSAQAQLTVLKGLLK